MTISNFLNQGLETACKNGDLQTVKNFYELGASLTYSEKPILYAVEYGHTHIVQYLLGKGVDPKITFNGETLLEKAVNANYTDIVKALIYKNADPDFKHVHLMTKAVENNNLSLVQFLVEVGYSHRVNYDQPYRVACVWKDREHIAQYLETLGVNLHAVRDYDFILYGVELGTLDDLKNRLKHYPDIDLHAYNDRAIKCAAEYNKLDSIEYLISLGCDIELIKNFGNPENYDFLRTKLFSEKLEHELTSQEEVQKPKL